jgi:hypothetical protein
MLSSDHDPTPIKITFGQMRSMNVRDELQPC